MQHAVFDKSFCGLRTAQRCPASQLNASSKNAREGINYLHLSNTADYYEWRSIAEP
jgi:hypothetical protein